MTYGPKHHTSRIKERIGLLAITIILLLLFNSLFTVLKRDFTEVPARLQEGTIVNLNDNSPGQRLKQMLEKGYYFEDARDIQLISSIVSQRLNSENTIIDNIGELNKSKYNVNADEAFASGGASFKKRVVISRKLLGFTGSDSLRFNQERIAPPSLSSNLNVGIGTHTISGSIRNPNGLKVNGVLVRLSMVIPQDSLYSAEVTEATGQRIQKTPALQKVYATDSFNRSQLISLVAYTRTDAEGKFSFSGLSEGKSYELLPLQPGFQFGSSKGVQELKDDASFAFLQLPHTIKLLSTKDFTDLKKEGSLIVRTPEQVSKWYWIIIIVFFIGFFLLHLIVSLRFTETDQYILPIIMLLTGLSLLTLLSLQDPLRDRFLARSTLWYLIGGFTGIFLLLLFDLRRFTTDSGLYRMFVFKDNRGAKGIQWAGLAMLLLLLTIILGTGPEGSGVKVNLFGFQPSEIVKFLIIIFLAGFFAANERFLAEYVTMNKRWSFFWMALGAILASILLFLMLGDLGPAIVVCFTFIILFSFSRGDFGFMVASVVLYVLANWVLKNIWLSTGVTILIMTLVMLFVRKQLSESAIMALVVVSGFMLLDQVPYLHTVFPGPVQRLTDRKAIWLNKWDNEVFGGDQIANGIWAMSSGGIQGQGVGEGFAKTIPEAHTDMILPSIGEDLGWAGIISIFILFLIYLHRSIIIGRQTGRPFLFYISAGIGIGSFVQFLLIAGGSIGALPLSGVSLPFVSYGGTSLMCNMLAAGFLLSVSMVRGSAVQMNYISKQQDKNLLPALLAACIGLILLTVNVSRYLFNNKQWVVQPALVANRSGARMFSYNPRIAILINKLQAGSLYDRNGILLATSKPEMIAAQFDSLVKAGLDNRNLQSIAHKRSERYYPFAEEMFFWVGDANTNVFNGGNNGFFAEYALDAELRGFETPVKTYTVSASRFRENRFLPRRITEMTVSQKDYTVLAPLLLAGINSEKVEAFKKRNRDVQLSMDAALQTNIQQSISKDDSLQDNRISTVILDDSTGDVLASAMYPLPTVNDWDQLNLSLAEQNKLMTWTTNTDLGFTYATQPGSTAKIATSLAAFNKLGMAAANKTILIKPQDLIRIKSAEPDEAGNISLERALVRSNNSYFIKLANEERLQEEMATIYIQTGMFLHGVGGYYYDRTPVDEQQQEKWRNFWRKTEFSSLKSYDKNDIRKTRGRGVSGMAWGQGELIATPAAIARLAASVSNHGLLVPHRFVLKISDSLIQTKPGVAIANDSQYAATLKSYMLEQSANKVKDLHLVVAGKTGTPERIWKGERINDGWYVFFVPKAKGPGHIVVCTRMEKAKGSSEAVKLAGKHIIPKLLQAGYIDGMK
jgi:cell division protein FtsW (lipid II flippase)